MSRRDKERAADILAAIRAIKEYLSDSDLSVPIVFDAVRMRFIEIGEAVKSMSPSVLEQEPTIPWQLIAGMRDRLAHRYFESERLILETTVSDELDDLQEAVERLVG